MSNTFQSIFTRCFRFIFLAICGRGAEDVISLHDDEDEEYEYRGVTLVAAYPHITPFLNIVFESPKYRFWIDQFKEQNKIDLKKFTLTDVPNFFGPPLPNRLGFFKGYGEAYEMESRDAVQSNIAFCRGECDACLVIATVTFIKKNGTSITKKMVPLVKQARFASGGYRIEAMAGMRDAKTRAFKGPIITEMEQEFGIKITEDDPRLKRLPGTKSWPSPGGSDEAIYHWYFEIEIDEDKYMEMRTRTYGEGDHEKIQILFFDLEEIDEVLNEIGDYKASDMIRRYRYMKSQEIKESRELTKVVSGEEMKEETDEDDLELVNYCDDEAHQCYKGNDRYCELCYNF
jgi:hypothetical protein